MENSESGVKMRGTNSFRRQPCKIDAGSIAKVGTGIFLQIKLVRLWIQAASYYHHLTTFEVSTNKNY